MVILHYKNTQCLLEMSFLLHCVLLQLSSLLCRHWKRPNRRQKLECNRLYCGLCLWKVDTLLTDNWPQINSETVAHHFDGNLESILQDERKHFVGLLRGAAPEPRPTTLPEMLIYCLQTNNTMTKDSTGPLTLARLTKVHLCFYWLGKATQYHSKCRLPSVFFRELKT